MYRIICCILAAGLGLRAQTSQDVARLNPALLKALARAGSADDAVSHSLSDTMMSLALQQRRPSQRDLDGLANALNGAMAGREISNAQASALSQCIIDVLRGDGTTNFVLASQVRAALTALRIGEMRADLIVRRFMTVAEAVRGPDDIPVRPEIRLVMPAPVK